MSPPMFLRAAMSAALFVFFVSTPEVGSHEAGTFSMFSGSISTVLTWFCVQRERHLAWLGTCCEADSELFKRGTLPGWLEPDIVGNGDGGGVLHQRPRGFKKREAGDRAEMAPNDPPSPPP